MAANRGSFAIGLCCVVSFLFFPHEQGHAEQTGNAAQVEARGLVSAPMRVEIRSRLDAPVSSLPFRSGDRFEAGELLLGFDCSRYAAEEKAARANANAAWIEYKSKKRLLAHGAAGKDEVNLAKARAGQASAEAEAREAINSGCRIEAPFPGRVGEVRIRQYEYPKPGEPLLVIMNDRLLEVELIVPSNWLGWLQVGTPFEFLVEETGRQVRGRIDRLSPEIDPVSQTIRIFGHLDKVDEQLLLPGMSGVARFEDAANG